MIDDRDRELGTVLSYLVGRRISPGEIAAALGVSRSTYYGMMRGQGRLASADNLLKLAEALDLNPIDLLVRCGLVSPDAVTDYTESLRTPPPPRRSRSPRTPRS